MEVLIYCMPKLWISIILEYVQRSKLGQTADANRKIRCNKIFLWLKGVDTISEGVRGIQMSWKCRKAGHKISDIALVQNFRSTQNNKGFTILLFAVSSRNLASCSPSTSVRSRYYNRIYLQLAFISLSDKKQLEFKAVLREFCGASQFWIFNGVNPVAHETQSRTLTEYSIPRLTDSAYESPQCFPAI